MVAVETRIAAVEVTVDGNLEMVEGIGGEERRGERGLLGGGTSGGSERERG